jgi:hypothetical protein
MSKRKEKELFKMLFKGTWQERQFPIKCDEADGKLDASIKQDRYDYVAVYSCSCIARESVTSH